MGLQIVITGSASQDLFATLQQIGSTGTLSNYWDVVAGAWSASVSNANREISLLAGTGLNAGSWTGGTGVLGTYSGLVLLRIHDRNQASKTVLTRRLRFAAGDCVDDLTLADLSVVATAVRDLLNAYPVPSSNVSAIAVDALAAKVAAQAAQSEATAAKAAAQAADGKLPADTTAKLNAAATDAAAAKTAAQAADGKLPADTTTKLGRLDVASSALSSSIGAVPAAVRAELNASPVPASNVATIAADALAAKTAAQSADGKLPADAASKIGTAAADATSAKVAAEAVSTRLTVTRAGLLDNLSAGVVATGAQVLAIQNSTRSKFFGPVEVQIPASGATTILLSLTLYDSAGNLSNADALPTVTAKNSAGVSRNANLGTVVNAGTGQYEVVYTLASGSAEELLTVKAAWLEGGLPQADFHSFSAVAVISGGGFTSVDRTKLDGVFNKLPSRPYLAGTAAADGDLSFDNFDGDRTSLGPSVAALATSASVAALPAAVRAELVASPVPASNVSAIAADALAAKVAAQAAQTDAGLAKTAAQSADGKLPADTAAKLATAAADATLAKTNASSAISEATAAKVAAQSCDGKLPADVAAKLTTAASDATAAKVACQGVAANVVTIKTKTNALPASPSAVGDVPTALAVAAQVAATLATAHGAGAWTQSGGDATLAKQDQILAQIAAVTPTPVSPNVVHASRTWRLRQGGDGLTAPNMVVISAASTVTLAVDFSDALDEDSSIQTVTDVVVVEGVALTASTLVPSGDRRDAHFNVSSPAAGLRKLRVRVSTTDGATLVGFCWLEVI